MAKRLTQAERDKRRRVIEANRAALAKARAERKAKAEAEKGRKSLKGLCPYGFAAALDAVLDGTVESPVKPGDRILLAKTFRGAVEGDNPEKRERIAYVRITHCPLPYVAALMRAFPDFAEVVCVQYVCEGDGKKPSWYADSRRACRVPIFPIHSVLAFFRAVWPDTWAQFKMKYLHGYTNAAVAENQSENAPHLALPGHAPVDVYGIDAARPPVVPHRKIYPGGVLVE